MIFVLLGLLAFIALIVLVAIGVAYIAVYGETLWLERTCALCCREAVLVLCALLCSVHDWRVRSAGFD